MQRQGLAVLIVLISLLAMALVGVAVVSPIGAESPEDAADRTVPADGSAMTDARMQADTTARNGGLHVTSVDATARE